ALDVELVRAAVLTAPHHGLLVERGGGHADGAQEALLEDALVALEQLAVGRAGGGRGGVAGGGHQLVAVLERLAEAGEELEPAQRLDDALGGQLVVVEGQLEVAARHAAAGAEEVADGDALGELLV